MSRPDPGNAALVQFAADVNTAARCFSALTDTELAALPPAAREGIADVFEAIADYTDGSSHRQTRQQL